MHEREFGVGGLARQLEVVHLAGGTHAPGEGF